MVEELLKRLHSALGVSFGEHLNQIILLVIKPLQTGWSVCFLLQNDMLFIFKSVFSIFAAVFC